MRKVSRLLNLIKRSPFEKDIKEIVGFWPKDTALYRLALRHSSAYPFRKKRGERNNERLEYLGDAVLDLVEFHHAGHLASFTFDAESELRLCQAETSVLSAQILASRFPWRAPGYLPLPDAAEDLRLSEVTAAWRALDRAV